MRVTKVDADGARAPELVYADAFEAAGSVLVRGDKYLRLKDGRGYVLAMDGSIPLVARVQPQVSSGAVTRVTPRARLAAQRDARTRARWINAHLARHVVRRGRRWAYGCTRSRTRAGSA